MLANLGYGLSFKPRCKPAHATASSPASRCTISTPTRAPILQSKAGTPRHAVLTDEGAALFAHWTAGRAGSEPLLLRPSGEPWRASHQGRPMREACERAKIVPALSFHGLRHTW